MHRSNLVIRAAKRFGFHNNDADDASVMHLRILRHERLCTAVPFPDLDWTDSKNAPDNLKALHDYAVQVANSAIDWYLAKKRWKKRFAKILHYLIYGVVTVAAIVPLSKIFNAKFEDALLKPVFGDLVSITDRSGFSAELALVLLGIAGGLALIDKYAGLTTGWMRYITIAADINRLVIDFQIEWNQLEYMASSGKEVLGKKKAIDPTTARFDLVKGFFTALLKLIRQETAEWADELKARAALLDRHSGHTGRP